MSEWEKNEFNEILQGDGFYISYNPDTTRLGRLFAGKGDETALVCKDEFLILDGDHRKEYEEALPRGYEACRVIYETHREGKRSSWSDDTPDADERVNEMRVSL